MTLTAGHQPNLYPYGGFFAKMLSVDKFVIVDNTQYVRKQYHNRNRIKLLNGNSIWLSIPVKNAGRFGQLINEVEIDNSQRWREKHKNTLLLNYKKAPCFDFLFPELEALLDKDWRRLVDFNIAFINLCAEKLEINTPLYIASGLGISGVSTNLILDICGKTSSNSYLHGKHSLDYVDFELMRGSGIKNYIQDFNAVPYTQLTDPFEPNLSILDIIFNRGADTRDILLNSNSVTEKALYG
jgi:hypothetical protein